jgi:glycosyltransferase involved in cell wall biosynthesis
VNVLTLTNMYPTESAPGEGAFVEEQVNAVRGLGLSVRVLVIAGPAGARKYLQAPRSLRRVLSEERFDLIHAHYGLSGAVAITQRKIPVVTTFHGSDTGYIPWQQNISWAVARLTTPIFVTAEGAARLGIADGTVIPCGIDTKRFHPIDRIAACRSLGWDEARRYVLLPGSRRQHVKRADLFDQALERAREEESDLVGVSLEDAPRERVALIMNAVDVTLLTSDSEGSPVAIKESLACSTPVVSVPVGDVPDLIKGLPGCAVAPREPQALADAVLTALRSERDSMLRDRVLAYDVARVAQRVVDVYAGVDSVHRRRRGAGPSTG